MADGEGDGGRLGNAVGQKEGLVVGIADGLPEGVVVGSPVGVEVGDDVGAVEGLELGAPEGMAVVGGSVGTGVWETKKSTEFATVPSPSHAIVSVYASSIAEEESTTEPAPSLATLVVCRMFPSMSSTLTSISAQALESPR